jgi:hypothetical protein
MAGMNKYLYPLSFVVLALLGIFLGYHGATLYYTNSAKIREHDTIRQFVRIDTLRAKVFCQGDTTAYLELKEEFERLDIPQNIYVYSWIMANKYNYNKAFMDMALSLEETFSRNRTLQPIDTTTVNIINNCKDKYNEGMSIIRKKQIIKEELRTK